MVDSIGKYRVERELGQGGFGKVYLAFDPDVGQPVAIKKLLAQGDPDLLKRFQLEIRTTASLRHKNIVTIHASGEEAGDPYLVMEFLEGHTLKQMIHGARPLTLLEKVRIMAQVAEGLAYAHSKGVVHRDVKPENIMLLPDDTVKIMDFGIALAPNRNTAVTQTGGIIGTPPYFAPEQLEGFKANEQTDIFSYGDVYYELLTGAHPFEEYKTDWRSLQIAICSYEPRAVGELVAGCPEALETLVHRTLAKEPEFRYRRFEEIQLDSEAILVDLRHEGADAIVREVGSLTASGDLQTALSRINHAYQLDPGNREVRRLREAIHLQLQKEQVRNRITQLLAEAEKQTAERRYAEAAQTLELGAKLDSTNTMVADRLQEAKAKLDSYLRANRLVAEARSQQQKGLLAEAEDRLLEALKLDPDHTDARRLSNRVREELARRRQNRVREQAIAGAREQLAARRFPEALAIVERAERELPEAEGWAELRAEIEREQVEEGRRRAERFQLAIAKTDETIETGDFPLARKMLDHLYANFAADPGAVELLGGLQGRLEARIRSSEIAQYEEKARGFLGRNSFADALDSLSEALGKYPDAGGLAQLKRLAEEGERAHRRSEALAAALRDATARRDAGDFEAALHLISKAREDFGDDAALVDLAHQLEGDLDRHRHRLALEALLNDGRELLAAGRHSELIERLERAREFSGEAGVRGLLDSARDALQRESRRQTIERLSAAIRRQIESGDWERAQAMWREARAEFPVDHTFEELGHEIESGIYNTGLRDMETRVRQHLGAGAPALAEQELEQQATRTIYERDPQWKALREEVAKRRNYEEALSEAGRRQGEQRFSEAERLLTEAIERGAPDQRAHLLRRAIEAQRSEASRQREIGRIAAEIRDRLNRGDGAGVESDLAAGRARYPGESVWNELQSGLDSLRRETALTALQAQVTASIERLLRDVGLPAASGLELLRRRGENLQRSIAELDSARAANPGLEAWEPLRAQIDARRAFLNAEGEIAEQLNRSLERGELSGARSQLAAARENYPDDVLWELFLTEIIRREEEVRRTALRRENEIAGVVQSVRGLLEDAVRNARSADLRTVPIRPQWETLRNAESTLAEARAKYPDDERLANLPVEIGARREEWERQIKLSVTGALRSYPSRETAAWFGPQIRNLRKSEPGAPLWKLLEEEIAALEALLAGQTEAAAAGDQVRECLHRGDVDQAATQLATARSRYPDGPLWATLESELTARRAELEEGRSRVETLLTEGNPAEAIDLIGRRFANIPLFAEPLNRARQALEEQTRREAAERARLQLLTIERQAGVETKGRKRKELDREAQRLAASCAGDRELAAIAARIHTLAAAPPVEAAASKPIPWKLILGGSGAAIAAALLLIFGHGKKAPEPPKPTSVSAVPIEIRTDPPGAVVHLGDRSCTTPNCQFQLTPGSYPLDAQLEGYVEQKQTLTADSSKRVYEFTMQPAAPPSLPPGPAVPETGTLVVQTGVAGALVSVDGTARTRTGQSGDATLTLDTSSHEVQVERNGYEKAGAQQVRIKAGAQQTALFRLRPLPAKLELDGAPAGVEVGIGSATLGRTNGSPAFVFPAPVPPGDQTLIVGLGTAKRAVQERFEAGQTEHLKWSDVAPATPAASLTATVPPPPKPSPEEIETRDWDRVQATSDVSQLRVFLQTHPNGAHANQAKSRMADLSWGAVDKTNLDALRQFLRDNPNNPHNAEAQKIADQLDAAAKVEAAKQESLKREADAKAAQEKVARQQIMDAISSLNSAIQRHKAGDIKKIWRGATEGFLNPAPGSKIVFNPKEQEIHFSAAGQATVTCDLVTSNSSTGTVVQSFTLIFRNAGAGWTMELESKK